MDLTVELLRLMGSPFARERPIQAPLELRDHSELMKLCKLSEKNRMLFFYLEKARTLDSRTFSVDYEKEDARRLIMNDSISKASEILSQARIEYAVFKTVRPYESTTVDIDVIIFREQYAKAVKAMQEARYSFIAQGPMSTTLWDKEANIGIDLYDEVAVSSITYIDKRKLVDYVTEIELPNNRSVKTLKPEADLACIIAHSVIKEQMYTLAEYYSFIYYLRVMDVSNFLQIVKESHIKGPAKAHATITALLHQTALEIIPDPLCQILNAIGIDNLEAAQLLTRKFETPHKYHPITIGRS